MTDLTTELAAVRNEIRRLTTDTNQLSFQGWPWESQHNTLNRLARYQVEEERLLDLIDTEERHLATLTEAAVRSGNPVVFAIAYVAAGVATEAA